MNVMLQPAPVPEITARFIAGPLQLLIGGEWVNAKSGKTFAVFDPATGREIAQVADSMGVMLPKTMNKEDQAEYDKLNGLSGNAFDMEYLTFMVKDHHKELHAFRLEAASRTDPTLHDEVVKAQGSIHEHTVMVDKLARAKGVPVPSHGGNKPAPAPTL